MFSHQHACTCFYGEIQYIHRSCAEPVSVGDYRRCVDGVVRRLPCSFVSLALLGSYACVSQLGEYDVDDHGSGIDYIKRVRFAPAQTEELLDRISELHRTHRSSCINCGFINE